MDNDYMNPMRYDDMERDIQQGQKRGENCFGMGTAAMADTLKEYIKDEIHDWNYYRILARRAPSREERMVFRQIGSDEMRHARRFSAAYFIATGNRYFPINTMSGLEVPPYRLALRERFMEERAAAVKYADTASKTDDPCLRELLLDTAKDEQSHALTIRSILENMPAY